MDITTEIVVNYADIAKIKAHAIKSTELVKADVCQTFSHLYVKVNS